jgi:hypothetical protein
MATINSSNTITIQPTIDGLTNIAADSITAGTLVTGDLSCEDLTCWTLDVSGQAALWNVSIDASYIVMDTAMAGLEFPDGSIQTTAAAPYSLGVVRRYLNAYSDTDQTNISTSAYNTVRFEQTDSYNGIHIAVDASGNPTKIVFDRTGAYLMIVSIQWRKDDAGTDHVFAWVAKNGVDIVESNTNFTLEKNGAVLVGTINYGINLVAGDYVQWRWFSADPDMYLHHDVATTINGVTIPSTPSIILSVEETNSTYNQLENLDISGNLTVSGDTDISGNLNVVGAITGSFSLTDLTLSGNLVVQQDASFNHAQSAYVPLSANDLTNKAYVDSQTGGAVSSLLAANNTWTGINTYTSELTVIGATTDCKFRVETYTDTDIHSNYADINLESINLNISGATIAQSISATSVDCDSLTATSVNAGIGTFTDDSGTTALLNVLEYPGGTVYTDFNPLSGDTTVGWTYILFSSNGTLTYRGISTSTNIKYVAIGAGGSSAGANQGAVVSLNGGSSAGAMSGEYKDGSFNTIPATALTISLGTSGSAGNGAFWTGTTYTAPTGAGNGTNTTVSGSMLSLTARCGDRQPTPSTTRQHGQDASGNFSSGGFDYGFGNQTGTGSTTRPTSGEFSTAANRCIGGGGCYADQPGYLTNFYTSGGTKRIDLYDGRYYYVYAGSSLATVNVEVATPTGIYRWGHGGDGPSGKYKASGGRNGARGGPSCVMFYFPTSTTTSIPGYALTTKGFYNTGYTIPNYDSGWFAATSNTAYSLTHNLNLNILYPPILFVYFTATISPAAPIFIVRCNGLINNNTTNYNSGIGKEDLFTDPNVFTFTTEENALYYATGGTNLRYDTGYLRVLIRY